MLQAYLPAIGGGVAAGLVLRRFVPISETFGTYSPLIPALLAVGGLVAWWVPAARSWLEQVDIAGPARAVRRLDDVLRQVVTEEWGTASARASIADAALAVGAALDSIADVLRRHEADLAAGPPGGRANVDVLDEILASDLRDAVETSLDGVWDQARSGSPTGSWELAAERMTGCLGDYEDHLMTHDDNDPPPFARVGRRRSRTLSGWGPPLRLADQLQTPADGPLVQLCRDRHVSLLSLNRIRSFRFAPVAVKDVVSEELARRGGGPLLAEMHWTGTGSLAGVLRLLAPRVGVVEMTWPSEDAAFPWPEKESDDA
jgi:hypothetical protein